MSWMVKGIPVPILIGLILLIVGGLVHIIGLATPYWHSVTITNMLQKESPYGHHGLWMSCANIRDVVDCASYEETAGFIVGTRALEVLALLMGVACMCITGLWFFLNITKFKLVFMISSLLTGFAAGLFGLIGIIVYAAEINRLSSNPDTSSPGTRFNYTLGWSFGLCTLSSIIVIIAVIFIAVGIRMRK